MGSQVARQEVDCLRTRLQEVVQAVAQVLLVLRCVLEAVVSLERRIQALALALFGTIFFESF